MKNSNKYKRFLKQSIARKFIIYIFLFSAVITIILTVIQLNVDYRQGLAVLKNNISVVEASHLDSITKTLWVSDMELVETQLNGMFKLSDMQHIVITDGGKIIAEVGSAQNEHVISESFQLVHEYDTNVMSLGTIHVTFTLTNLYNRLLTDAVVIVITHAIKTLLVSFFIFIIFYRLIGKHLVSMSDYTTSLRFNKLDFPLSLDRQHEDEKYPDELGTVVAAINQMRQNLIEDVSKRVQVENKLRQSEEQWSRTFNSFTDFVTLQDPDLRLLKVNQAACTILDMSRDEIVGQHCYEIFDCAGEPCQNCPILKTKKTLKPSSQEMYHEKLGKTFFVSVSPVVDDQGNLTHIAHVARDITEKKQLESQLQQAQKMEAVGTLAGGIAHDFNNILSAIIGYSELIKEEVPANSTVGKDIAKILVSGERAADLVKQILTFSRKGNTEKQPIRPHLIVKEALKMLRATLPTTILIKEDIDPDCGVILADPTSIHQITLNLCTNALHAMADQKGTLSVSVQHQKLRAAEIGEETLSPGPFVVLTVSDTGCGMDQPTIERIFEPYFTTKEMGKGTGLGLAVIHGIVHDAQGFIRVESTPGEGSSFIVYLPVLHEKISTEQKSDKKVPLPKGSEHILVVDDEPFLVRVTQRQLENLGYTVTTTTDSKTALEKIKTAPEQFDLLITDQTMPGLTGVELALAVKEIKPDLPVILCTGHSDLVSKEKAMELGIKKYVLKPVIGDELLNAVQKVLVSCQL